MPTIYQQEQFHAEELQDIITTPPSWLLRWGIILFFAVIILLFGMSALIRYPDIVKTQLKINSANSPKPVITKNSGKIIRLLVRDNQEVTADQPLAYLESTASHIQVLDLLKAFKKLQQQLYTGSLNGLKFLDNPGNLQLGETQEAYQGFFQSYLAYKSAISDGFYLKKRSYLQKDLANINRQRGELQEQKKLQQKEYALAEQEYAVHQKLAEQKVVAQMELKREESKFLSKKHPLQQTEIAFITNAASSSAKEKEIMELDNQIREERSKFIHALNSLISALEIWKSKYVLSASQSGKIAFAGIIQENQFINAGDEIFYVNPGNTDFFGEMPIPQYNMGKVRAGQEVLIKLKSYPYEEYGMLRGKINYIAEVPYRDSVFVSKVNIGQTAFSGIKRSLKLKNGMTADAEIITEDVSLLNRVSRNIIKMLK